MPTKSEEIVKILEDQIIACDLEPGSSLFEVELSERFKVSRTPVREALLKLERRGLIRSVPYKGFAVNPIALKDVFELYELRTVIEVYTAGVAAQRMDRKTLARLEKLTAKKYAEEGLEARKAFVHDDHRFHLTLASLTGNSRIEETLRDVLKQLQRVYYLGLKNRTGRATHEEHRAILQAIKEGDTETARELMETHIALAKKRALEALE